jgi:DNA repair exonuclease SbcCD ATPase subunit
LAQQPIHHPHCPFCGNQQPDSVIDNLQAHPEYGDQNCPSCGSKLHLIQKVDYDEALTKPSYEEGYDEGSFEYRADVNRLEKDLDEKTTENLATLDSIQSELNEKNDELEKLEEQTDGLQQELTSLQIANAKLLHENDILRDSLRSSEAAYQNLRNNLGPIGPAIKEG